jgi:flagellar protein FlgJ
MTNSVAAALGQSVGSIGDAQSAQAMAQLKAMFLNSMFQQMFTGIDGEGPFGGSGSLKVWRSFLTDEYAKTFAKTGGLGIASHVYDQLLRQQGIKS